MINVTGIYKITSPTGKVYIGQSRNIGQRKSSYKGLHCNLQTRIFRSIIKYGWDSHSFEVIHKLPVDITQEVIDVYEKLYMDFYSDAGFILLNLKEGGSRGVHCQETKNKISLKLKGKPNSPKAIRLLIERNKTRVISKETKNRISESLKGRISPLKGKHHSDASKRKMSTSRKGKSFTIEHRLKLSKSKVGERNHFFGKSHSIDTKKKISKAGIGRKHSQEVIRKISIRLIGNTFRVGKKHSNETKNKMSVSATGRMLSDETKEKISKKVLNVNTGQIFNSVKIAAEAVGIPRSSLTARLNGSRMNKTGLSYMDNFKINAA